MTRHSISDAVNSGIYCHDHHQSPCSSYAHQLKSAQATRAKCWHYHNSILTCIYILKYVASVPLSYTVSLVDVSVSLSIAMLFDEWAFSCLRNCKSTETQPTSISNALSKPVTANIVAQPMTLRKQ